MNDDAPYGPFNLGLDPIERAARCRAFATCVHFLVSLPMRGEAQELVTLLRRAETDDEALAEARKRFERVPPLQRRRVLTSFSTVEAANRGENK